MGIKKEERPATIPAGLLQYISTIWLTKLLLQVKSNNNADEKDFPEFSEDFQIASMERKFEPYFQQMALHVKP